MQHPSLDYLPVWAMLIATVVIVFLAIEGGYWLGKTMLRRPDHEQPASLGTILGAVLAHAGVYAGLYVRHGGKSI